MTDLRRGYRVRYGWMGICRYDGRQLVCGKWHYSTHGYRAVGTAWGALFVSYTETFSRPSVPFADQSGGIVLPSRHSELHF
jgi:hypothetical protein